MRQNAPLHLPALLQRQIDATARTMLAAGIPFDFSQPIGEGALVPYDSLSWRIFKNPLTLFIGGVTAVLLELAEPRVRHGVWDHSSFRADPVTRLKRTGLAAMMTVYGPKTAAEAMIAGVGRRHAAVYGVTDSDEPYRADDPELLTWVQATASYSFLEAYSHFVAEVPTAEKDGFYREALPAARLYGAVDAPSSEAACVALFARMNGRLEASAVLFEFLAIMRKAPLLPRPLHGLQVLLTRAAVSLLPSDLRARLGLSADGLSVWQEALLRHVCRLANRIPIATSPAAQSCQRLGLPPDFLYRGEPVP